MSAKKKSGRRAFLRGAGTVAIGLPFLAELAKPRAKGAPGDPPERLVTVFFGLGLDPSWQRDFDGPLQPLAPFADKMATFSTSMEQGHAGGAHCNTSTVVFVGERQRDTNVAGGASLDQILRNAVDPGGATLASGLWWRRGACDAQALRVYNPDGSGRPPIKRPSEVFDTVFGSVMPPDTPPPAMEDPAARRARRIRRSVLDTVMEQYRSLQGERSPLGVESKRKITQHLASIREIETQLAPADEMIEGGEHGEETPSCMIGERPRDPDIADYDRFTYGTGSGAPTIHHEDVREVFSLHAQLYALALRCDLVRFGNLMFESAGGHMNLEGTYSALGGSTNFPGDSQHDSYFHGDQPHHARLYQHFAMSCVAEFLAALDDPDFREDNGGTVLENATIVLGTEYGWNHSKQDVFHAVLGGRGRFRRGSYVDRHMNCVDLYDTILQGHGLDVGVGRATGVEPEGDASVLLA